MKSRRSKACDISSAVKKEVWERDNHQCIICGSPFALPNSHYIRRSKGGLGIPENIGTMCIVCHNLYDDSLKTDYLMIAQIFKTHLRNHYPDWDEKKLTYRKR